MLFMSVAAGWEGGVDFLGFGARAGRAGEGAPGLDEVEIAVIGAMGVGGADVGIVERHLGGDEGGFKGDEASLTPTDICQLVDEGFFHVIGGGERGADAGDVEEEIGFIFNGEDDVDGGGEAVFEGVLAGFGLAFVGGGAIGFGTVDAGLLRLRASSFGGRVDAGEFVDDVSHGSGGILSSRSYGTLGIDLANSVHFMTL